MCASGTPSTGLEQFRSGLEAMRTLGAELRLPFDYALLEQSYARACCGKPVRASQPVSRLQGTSRRVGDLRVAPRPGDLSQAEGRPEQASIRYQRALESAQRCGSQTFAQRARASLEGTIDRVSTERFQNGAPGTL